MCGTTTGGALVIPRIFSLAEAAARLRVSESYLRSKLRDRTFSGVKLAGRWAMTESQIEQAIGEMTTQARPADPKSPAGLSDHSRYRRRLRTRNPVPTRQDRKPGEPW